MIKQVHFSFYVILINLKSHTWLVVTLLSSADCRLIVPPGLFPRFIDTIALYKVSLKEPHLERAMSGTTAEHFVSPLGLGQSIQGGQESQYRRLSVI